MPLQGFCHAHDVQGGGHGDLCRGARVNENADTGGARY